MLGRQYGAVAVFLAASLSFEAFILDLHSLLAGVIQGGSLENAQRRAWRLNLYAPAGTPFSLTAFSEVPIHVLSVGNEVEGGARST